MVRSVNGAAVVVAVRRSAMEVLERQWWLEEVLRCVVAALRREEN